MLKSKWQFLALDVNVMNLTILDFTLFHIH